MTPTETIKTRPDGSIDTAHYMARGRKLRSKQAHYLAKTVNDEAQNTVYGWLMALVRRAVARTA